MKKKQIDKLRREIRRIRHQFWSLFEDLPPFGEMEKRRYAKLHDKTRNFVDKIEARFRGSQKSTAIAGKVKISVLIPVNNVAPVFFNRAVVSVLRQSYTNWQLILVDDFSSATDLLRDIRAYGAGDRRILVDFLSERMGVSAATNKAISLADGDYIAILQQGDLLTVDALEVMASAIDSNNQPDWLYSDECVVNTEDRVTAVSAKPHWSPSLLFNFMYTGNLSLYRRDAVNKLGGFRSQFDCAQDFDLALRMADQPRRVVHVEKVLYGRRAIPELGADVSKLQARSSSMAAVQDAIDRRGILGRVVPQPSNTNRIVRCERFESTGVSIIVPSDDEEHIFATAKSIFGATDHLLYEVIIVTNAKIEERVRGLIEDPRLVFVRYDLPFNFSEKCNVGANAARHDYVIFYNDDVRVLSRDWITILLEHLTLPGVGGVSPKLLYENGNIQYGGMVCGVREIVGTFAHALPADTTNCFNLAQSVREVSILSGALLAMRLDLFKSLGGFDAANTPIRGSDVDLSLRIWEAGYSCLYVPYASLWHIGHLAIGKASRTDPRRPSVKDKSDRYLLQRFGRWFEHDPFFTSAMWRLYYHDTSAPFSIYAGAGPAQLDIRRDVLIVTHDLEQSGAPRIAVTQAISLKRGGAFVVVVSPLDGAFRQTLVEAGITVIIDPTVLKATDPVVSFARHFDVVIGHTVLSAELIFRLFGETDAKLYVHEDALVAKFMTRIPEPARLRARADQVWALSPTAQRALAAVKVKSVVVLPGVDDLAQAEKPVLVQAKHLRITVVARYLESRKGQDIAISAISLLPPTVRARVRLVLYGGTLHPSFEEALVTAVPDKQTVIFAGTFLPSEAVRVMSETDILLVPSREESLSLVAIEAMSLGKPVICSPDAGVAEYLEDGVSALIPVQNTPEAIAEAITRLFEDEAFRNTIGLAGRSVFERRFSLAAFDRRVLERLGWRTDRLIETEEHEFGNSCEVICASVQRAHREQDHRFNFRSLDA